MSYTKDGCEWSDKHEWAAISLGLCGCSEGDAYDYLLAAFGLIATTGVGSLGAMGEIAATLLEKMGLADHGVSIRCAFLTVAGKKLYAEFLAEGIL